MQLPQVGFPIVNAFLATPLGEVLLAIFVLGVVIGLTFVIVNIKIRNAANPGARFTNLQEPELEETLEDIDRKL